MITTQSMKAGFTGGLVVDYPNSTKASSGQNKALDFFNDLHLVIFSVLRK
jgi:hypothetical protein